MDLPSKNMYDTFKDEIWKELGPLDPDWFETLTAQTLTNEGNVSDQDELCANQEGNFKAPFDKSAAESQLFSTPKVFRHSRVVSPETEDEHSFTAEHEKETLPWTATQSPCLFGMPKEGFQDAKHGSIQHQNEDSFDLLRSPQKSPVSHAKHISESLGAQIHPDISWTSSLNTPPAIPSTLILTKLDESPCPLTVSADKNVVFVRKLFPSLSNASRTGAMSPKSSDMPTVHKGVVSPVAGQNPESLVSPQSSLNQSEGVWRPKLPDAIEDGEIRSTVASVLDGAEDVLSIFFTNSSSALRKVKTDRIKRKQAIPTKEHGCSSTDVSTTNNAASSEQKTSDEDSGRHLSPLPVKTGDVGNTQWSPLSLSDIPPCTVDSSCHDNGPATHVENSISTEQLQRDFDSGQQSRPHMKMTDSGFTKKKRKFVYTIKTSKLQFQGIEKQSQKMDSSPGIPDSGQNVNVKQLVRAPDEEECCNISKNEMQKQGNLTEENLPPSVQAKIQDLDISQLSRDFAQDFSQMPEPVTLTRVAEDTHRNGFSPSACLSAMKQANQKAGQANLAHDYDDVSNRRSVATTYQNYSINEGTIGDSGFQSAVADTTHVTASSFAVPSSENNGHSQRCTGFKTDIQRCTFTSTSKGSRKTQLDDDLREAGIDADMPSRIEGSKTLDPGRESELHVESTSNRPSSSARGTIDNTNCFPLNGQLHGGLPKETTVSLSSVHASGFKTASNKGIEISSANLERAKLLFEETEGERILSDQHIRCPHDTKHELGMSHGSVKDATFDSNQPPSSNDKSVDSSCQLTASQKADVTELCTLLEEADSQFEFTQFKTGKLKQDDVTSHQEVDKELDPDFLTGIDFDDSFNSDLEKHLRVHDKMTKVSDDETSTATSKSTGLSLSGEMKKENSSTEDAPSSSKQISECSKSVMSDENKNLYRAGHTETSKLEKNNPLMLGVGFKTAGGNVLRVSKKCLSKAKALFADLEENLMINEKFPDKHGSETDAKTQRKCKMDQHTGSVLPHKQDGGKITCSDMLVTGIRDEDATECPNISKVDTAKCQSGFQMASGKGISISAKAIQEADALFKDCDVMDTSACVSVQHKKSTEPLSGVGVSVSHKKNLQKFKNVQGMKANFSKEPINEVEGVNAGPTARHTDAEQHKVEIHKFSLKSTAALTGAASFHGNSSSTAKGLSSLSYKTSKNIGSSVVNELSASVGFSTARGEKVLVSADALKKAKCLLNDIDALQDTNTQRKQKDGALGAGHRVNQIQGSPPKNGGFQTASGKGFTISSAALKRAKMLFSECGEVDDKTGEKPSHSEMPVPSPAPRNRGFLAASGKPMAFSSEALQKAKALFSDITSSAETPADTRNGDKRQDKDKRMDKMYSGFSNAEGAKVHVSLDSTNAAALHGNPPLISMHPPLCQTSKNISCSANIELSNIGGICTASGKKDSILDDATTKAKSLFNENTTFEDANKLLKQKVDSLPQQNGGFQTASGKGVVVSSAALKKAKTLLSVCEGVEDKISVQPTCSKMTVPGPSGRSHGFVAASGKPVAFSSEALEKAKALFGDISSGAESPDVSNSRNGDKKQDKDENKEKIHCGFSTAGGAKVHVSPGNLLRAKNLLKEFDGSISATAMQEADAFFMDGDIMDSRDGITASGKNASVSRDALTKAKSQFDENATFEKTNKWLTPKLETVPSQNGGFQTASGKGVAISSAALKKAKTLFSECEGVEDKIGVQPTCSKMTVPGPSGRSHGFLAASGKPVAFSSEALEKAKALFGDISSCAESPDVSNSRNSDKKQDTAENKEKIHCGFSTAGGAKVHVSPGNLLRAKNLLKEFDGSISATAMQEADAFFMDGDIMDSRDGITASGKNASVSHDALTKVKSQFDENATFEKTNKWLTPKLETVPSQNGGFQTASGKGVVVSSAALKKAKTLFSECEGVQDEIDVKPTCSKMPVTGPPPRIHGFLAASGKPVAISSEAFEKAKALFGDISSGAESPDVSNSRNGDKKRDKAENKEKIHCGFSTAGGAKVHVSPGNLLRAKNLLKEFDGSISATAMQEADAFFMDGDIMDSRDGITASGKNASVSHDALTKVKSQFDENATFEKTNKWLTPKLETVPSQNGGFQTASGKGVAISSAALKKAKTLFSECEGIQDEIDVKPTCSKMPVTGPPPRNHGFLAASGKPVAISSEAFEKAKALFGDISPSSETPTVSCTRNSEQKDALNGKEKTHCGFSTAGGAKVYVSQKNLLKAKNLLKDLADGECHDLSPHDSHKSIVNDVTRTSNFPTASDKDIPTKDSAPEEVKCVSSLQQFDPEIETFQKSSALGNILIKAKAPTDASKVKEGKMTNLHDSPREEMASVLDPEINQTSSSEGKQTEESSVLYCHSLNLTGCTETQRRFLAQEALDCTKALLEDENLSEQKLSMTSVNVPLQGTPKSFDGSVEEQKQKGKRLVEDPDITGQPPLKRRLLEEFDRTVDGPRGSVLEPHKSSPIGVMKDRRVFKYSASLHPNITRPHRNGTNYVETRLQKTTPSQHSTPGDSISAHSKMSMFVPPFLKNVKTESLNHAVLKDNVRTPSAFVPPFKKQRTIVQESSSKPPEEDKRHHLFVMPLKSNTYVPPTKNTQLSVTDNKSKEDVQMVTLADTTKDNLIDNQSLSVGCEPEESSTEASLFEDKLPQSQDMFQNLPNVELARDMQDMRLRKKKRQTIRPLPGSLFLTKTSGVPRIPLKAAVNGKPPARYTQKQLYSRGLHQHVCEITSDTAECFRFSLKQFVKQEAFIDGGGVQLADGGWLIPSNDGTAGKEEFYRALCDTPGVDPKLISEEWVYNHYRWIVWKQAAMERSFPETMGSLCLTPEQVLLQLKYRYDVEVDHSRRPALRKIMEQDDTAAKTLVLCVCGVVSGGHSTKRQSVVKTPSGDAKVENQSGVVWLTDGWYGIKTQLDEPLTAMLQKGRLAVGGKLITSGAQLVGSQAACSPLEAPDSLMLKICANSSRPARWDAKLGFHRDPRPLLLPVSSMYSNGGPVGCVDIVILRSYPIQWMERKPDGGVVFRSVRAEEKEARRYNSHKQKAMESLFAKVQDEFEKEERGNKKPQRRRRTMSRQDIAGLQDGEELYEAVGNDPAYLEAHLSEQQLQTLHSYRRSLMEKKQAELQDRYRRALESAEDREGSCPKRDVTPVWRLCIADSTDQHSSVYQLNLWRPPSDLQSLLKEGCRYKVYHLTASEGKKPVGSTSVQLTGTKKTQFQDLQASQEWLSTHFQPRFSTHFVDLQNTDFQPLCGEVDLTGYVISIIDGQGSSPAFYLADGNLNFIKVRCFSSLAQSGLEDVVKPRVLLALSNLQLRGQSTSPTPVVFAGDLTVFSTNPKEVHLQESLSQLRNLIQGQANFSQTAEEKLSHLIKCDGLSSTSSPALQTRTPASAPTTDRRQDTKTSMTSQQPVRSSGSFTPLSRNPPAQNCSTEKDPSILKRRRALDYLSRIPSPPPLSNLGSVASPCVNKTFVPPRRSVTPSTLKTEQTPARKAVSSPVEEEWVNDEELAMIDTDLM